MLFQQHPSFYIGEEPGTQPSSRLLSEQSIQIMGAFIKMAHLITCTGCGETMSFEDGYAYIYGHIQEERIRFIYQCGVKHALFKEVLALEA